MSIAEAKKMIAEKVGAGFVFRTIEYDLDKTRKAYIALFDKPAFFGTPIIVIEENGKCEFAGYTEARRIAASID